MALNIKSLAEEAWKKAQKAAGKNPITDYIIDELGDVSHNIDKKSGLEWMLANPKFLHESLKEGTCEMTESLNACISGAVFQALWQEKMEDEPKP